MQLTRGFLLGGAVRHDQLAQGHRTGLEPVLLAAFCSAKPGSRVIEAGTGSGAALLCLAHRVAITGVGIERDTAQAAVARHNIAANANHDLAVLEADLAQTLPEGRFDHAIANPPWHEHAATASPDPGQDAARRAPIGLFDLWARRLAQSLRHRGTISFITSAATTSQCLAAFTAAGCGSHSVFPLWPRLGAPAKLVLLGGIKGGRGPTRLLPGLILHDDSGLTQAASHVLRQGAALPS